MVLEPGTRLSHYEILELCGKGGMGEVYRARDTRLDRDVAIKVLPAELNQDETYRSRLEREAKTISQLQHPHVCTLFDVGSENETQYLVMEYLEGETLQDRLRKGPLPIQDVLRIGSEIAEAIEAAHRQGVIHRDLKPGNVMLTKLGTKVLDFGLAKGLDARPLGDDTHSPTLAAPVTSEGTIVGTLFYMAPEQLEGKEADARTDIFAFGAVLHEMATGQKAFEGDSQVGLMSAILKDDPPDISTLEQRIPPGLARVVRICLAKDSDDRWQSAGDLLRELQWIAETLAQADPPVAVVSPWRSRQPFAWMLTATILFLAVLVWGALAYRSRSSGSTAAVRFEVSPPEKMTFTPTEAVGAPHLAVSPDARHLAFVAAATGAQPVLWVRALDSLEAQALPGTEGASFPFWSPDSRFIGFFSQGKLKRIEVSGGSPQTLSDALQGRGGTWNQDGVILFAPNINDPVHRVSADGIAATPVTKLEEGRQETSHRWPYFLPDGRHFLYLVRSAQHEHTGIYMGSLDSAESTHLLEANEGAAYAPPGYLLVADGARLLAHPFNARRRELMGDPFPLAEQFSRSPDFNYAAFTVSQTGVLAYGSGLLATTTQLLWFDRSGQPLGSIGAAAEYSNPSLSPDGRHVAVARFNPQAGTRDIWLLEASSGTGRRFTFDPGDDADPMWSPDGDRIVFRTNREGAHGDLYQKMSSGAGSEEELFTSRTGTFPTDWSSDGQTIVYQSPGAGWDLWLLRLDDRTSEPILRAGFNEMHGRLSPDERWMVYSSDESGRHEVYVQPFPPTGGKWQISTNGGSEPRWRHDGSEIFYLDRDLKLTAVAVKTEATFEAGIPASLFEARIARVTAPFGSNYAVSADGQRFLINTVVEGGTSAPITVVVNWAAQLRSP